MKLCKKHTVGLLAGSAAVAFIAAFWYQQEPRDYPVNVGEEKSIAEREVSQVDLVSVVNRSVNPVDPMDKETNKSGPLGDDDFSARFKEIEIAERKELENFKDQTLEEQFRTYISSADFGNPSAQFMVARLFKQCSRMSSEETLNRLRYSADFPEDAYRELVQREKKCEGIRSFATSNEEASAKHDAWLETAADQGDPLARLTINIEQYAEVLQEDVAFRSETRELLYDALQQSSSDPVLFEQAIWQGLSYYSMFVEDDVLKAEGVDLLAGHYKRGELSDAWRLLWCAHTSDCDPQDYLAMLSENYYEYEVNAAFSRAKLMRDALFTGNWEAFGLEKKQPFQ